LDLGYSYWIFNVDIGIELQMENVTDLLTTKQLNKIFGWATEHRDLPPQFMAMVFSTVFFWNSEEIWDDTGLFGHRTWGCFSKITLSSNMAMEHLHLIIVYIVYRCL